MHTKKRVDITISRKILVSLDEFCAKNEFTRSGYIEYLIRCDFEKRKIDIDEKKEFIWHGDIEDMPLHID